MKVHNKLKNDNLKEQIPANKRQKNDINLKLNLKKASMNEYESGLLAIQFSERLRKNFQDRQPK